MKLIHSASRRILVLALVLTLANAVNAIRPDQMAHNYISLLNLLGGIVLALEGLLLTKRTYKFSRQEPPEKTGTDPVKADPAKVPAAPPRPVATREERTRHELAALLGLFQEKGRLVDFLMEDITSQPDARVGQVARVVHQGCREVLDKHFQLKRVTDAAEGSPHTLEAGHDPASWCLVGSVSGEAPQKGTVLHAGWRTEKVALPEITREIPESSDSYLVAPAELEVST
ncbi:MAG: DUF2760 domain-containing protein [Verrucomicrobia bacterium]|nr:DUF2760 domain-containing protein [Verrucomicrobiota bacterium]MCH8513421.1 DUF2760 domain-containing protein [Kiritimatiellia bacterium]